MTRTLTTLVRRSPSLSALAAIHVALVVVFLCALQIDATQVTGVARWIKPTKFALSIAIYLATIAWLLPATGLIERTRRRLVGVIGGTMSLEMVLITVQAARGTTSHFNAATLLDGAIFTLMGVAIAANTVAVAWLCAGAWRLLRHERTGYQVGVVAGFVVFLLGSAIGGGIVANNAHTVGAPDGGPGLPFVNWSTVAGDLRIAHFVGMHALQALPLIGAWLERRAVYAAAVAWGVVTAALAVQAAMGRPLP